MNQGWDVIVTIVFGAD